MINIRSSSCVNTPSAYHQEKLIGGIFPNSIGGALATCITVLTYFFLDELDSPPIANDLAKVFKVCQWLLPHEPVLHSNSFLEARFFPGMTFVVDYFLSRMGDALHVPLQMVLLDQSLYLSFQVMAIVSMMTSYLMVFTPFVCLQSHRLIPWSGWLVNYLCIIHFSRDLFSP